MDITEATMRGGIGECLNATLHKDNIPTYVGIGGGLVLGNAVGKKMQSWYDNYSATPNRFVQLGIRTVGRLVTSGAICAFGGSYTGTTKEALQMAAVGSAGFIPIDLVRELGSDPNQATPSWIDDYLTLQVPTRKAVRVSQRSVQRAASRPVALQNGRPAMESAALQPEGALMRTASLRV